MMDFGFGGLGWIFMLIFWVAIIGAGILAVDQPGKIGAPLASGVNMRLPEG